MARPAIAPFGISVAACLVLGTFACARLPALPHALALSLLLAASVVGWWRCRDWKR